MSKKIQQLYAREQYYIKRGKKYFKVNDPVAYDGLEKGAWLVIVKGNCTSIRSVVNPKLTELDAAMKYLEDSLCDALADASKMRPSSTPISKKEQEAWKTFEKTMGNDMPKYFEYASFSEIAQKGCAHIKKIMLENNMDIDKIREKYEIKKNDVKNSIFSLGIEE